tara:strand:+ start:2022 stop:4508 length:2487 start_codon:yes stop_codon:yes gene_type:complete
MLCTVTPALSDELDQPTYELDIKSQPLMAALKLLSDETGLDVLFFSDVAEGVDSTAIAGRYSQNQALEVMLADTDLEPIEIGKDGAMGIRLKNEDSAPGKAQPTPRQILLARSSALNENSQGRNELDSRVPDDQNRRGRSSVIEEILVTAEKRVTNLQDTPLTITAFSGEQLQKSGVATSMDLQLHTPGLVMSSNGGWGLPYLRGVGTDIIGPGVDSGVAIYVDGVYQARNAGKIQQLIDIERIEVLKGPQGILYGRNAIGGAINIISKGPSDDLTGNVGIELGNFEQRTIHGSIGGPLAGNTVSGRLSFISTDDDGFVEDLLSGDRYQFTDSTSLRGSLAIELADNLDVRINASYSDTDSAFAYTPINPETNPSFTVWGATVTGNPRKVLNDFPNQQETQEWGINAKFTWDLDAFTVTSNTAFNNNEHTLICDLDGTEVSIITCGSRSFDDEPYNENSDFFSQEIVLTTHNSDRFEWTALLYYMQEDATLFGRNDLPLFGLVTRTYADVKAEAVAAAGQLTYSLSDKIRLIGGLRVSHESKSIVNSKTAIDGSLIGSADDDDSWTVATPKFVIQYSPTDDIMAYLSATRGFKSGGFNALEIQGSFDEETLWSYEAGLRTTLLDNRLRANLTAFHYEYEDLQINQWQTVPSGILGTVKNAGQASTNGVELELSAKPSDRFQLEVGLALLDAKFDEFVSLDPDRPEDGLLDRAGNALPRAPDFTANVAAEYSIPLGNAGDLTLRGEYFYRDEIFITQFEDDRAGIGAINITNARLSFDSSDGRWRAALYGKNLSDKNYAQHIITIQALLGQVAVFAPPRTYGIHLGYNF